MNINFECTKRLQANIHNAIDTLNLIGQWLTTEKKYKKDDSGKLVEDGKQLSFNRYTNQPIEDYALSISWRISFPVIFHCTDEELPIVIENNYSDREESYRTLLLNVAKEHNPQIEDVEQEFIQNLESYDPDSINNLINVYRAQWKGHIPKDIKKQCGSFIDAYEDKQSPLYDVLHKAVDCELLGYGEIHIILSRLDWIVVILDSIGERINALFEKWQSSTLIVDSDSISQYKISEDKTTDFIKIISAMYDCRMFETIEGKVASNKKELIKTLGKFFNAKIDDYSPLLSAAKRNANYLDIFDKLKEKGESYYTK